MLDIPSSPCVMGSILPVHVWPGGLKALGAGSGIWETPSRAAGSIAPPPSRREMPLARSSAGTSGCPWEPGEGHGINPEVVTPTGMCRSHSLQWGRGNGLRFLACDGEGCPHGTGSRPEGAARQRQGKAEGVSKCRPGDLSHHCVPLHQGQCRRGTLGKSSVAAWAAGSTTAATTVQQPGPSRGAWGRPKGWAEAESSQDVAQRAPRSQGAAACPVPQPAARADSLKPGTAAACQSQEVGKWRGELRAGSCLRAHQPGLGSCRSVGEEQRAPAGCAGERVADASAADAERC